MEIKIDFSGPIRFDIEQCFLKKMPACPLFILCFFLLAPLFKNALKPCNAQKYDEVMNSRSLATLT